MKDRAIHVVLMLACSVALAACGSRIAMVGDVSTVVHCPWRVELAGNYAQILQTHQDSNDRMVVDGIATLRTTTLANHDQAVARLIAISRERTEPVSLVIGDIIWPAIIRRFSAPLDGDSQRRIGPSTEQWLAITYVSAIDNQLVRIEGRVSPRAAALLDSIENMGSSISSVSGWVRFLRAFFQAFVENLSGQPPGSQFAKLRAQIAAQHPVMR